jgi:hypothetical protein
MEVVNVAANLVLDLVGERELGGEGGMGERSWKGGCIPATPRRSWCWKADAEGPRRRRGAM